jgi:predicted ferric reductase
VLSRVTFYLKKKIGAEFFRKIHYLSLVAYVGATLHGLYAGTDSVLPLANLLYKGTFLITLFLVVYWIVLLNLRRQEEEKLRMQHSKGKLRHNGKFRSTTALKNSH